MGRGIAALTLVAGASLARCGVMDGSTASPMTCQPGAPPLDLARGLSWSHYNGMVSDGTLVYVTQGVAPLLFAVPTNGGDVMPLTGGVSGEASVPIPLLATRGGVFFDDDGVGLAWESPKGGLRAVSSSGVSFFDWSGARAYALSADGSGPGSVDVVSLDDGSRKPFATFGSGDDVAIALATSRFLHLVLVVITPSIEYVDRRIDLADGSVHDEVPLHSGNSQIFMGPNAICAISADNLGISCVRDDETSADYIPVGSASFPRYVDADWVYAEIYDAANTFARFSLTDGHEQALDTGVYPGAVATFGGCVYAAIFPNGSPTSSSAGAIRRYSPE